MRAVLAKLAMSLVMGLAAGMTLGGSALAQGAAQRPAFDAQAYAEGRFGRLFTTSGRYMEMGGVCSEPTLNYPGYAGKPVLHCTYRARGVTADVWMLNADAARLAKWSVSACNAIQTRVMRTCLDRVIDRIWGASNGQFPVAGYVVQPGREVGVASAGETPYCSLVRNGVTINVRGFRTRPARNGQCGPVDLIDDPLTGSGQFARPVAVTRAQLRAAGVTDVVAGDAFVEVAGKLYRDAWNADDNPLITAWAKAARRAGELR